MLNTNKIDPFHISSTNEKSALSTQQLVPVSRLSQSFRRVFSEWASSSEAMSTSQVHVCSSEEPLRSTDEISHLLRCPSILGLSQLVCHHLAPCYSYQNIKFHKECCSFHSIRQQPRNTYKIPPTPSNFFLLQQSSQVLKEVLQKHFQLQQSSWMQDLHCSHKRGFILIRPDDDSAMLPNKLVRLLQCSCRSLKFDICWGSVRYIMHVSDIACYILLYLVIWYFSPVVLGFNFPLGCFISFCTLSSTHFNS